MNQTDPKLWWQSKTIWVQIVAGLFAILAHFDVLPKDIDQADVVTLIMAAVTIVTSVLRLGATAPVAVTKQGLENLK